MSVTAVATAPAAGRGGKDIGFAVAIILILCLFFLPVPAMMIHFGLALSIVLSGLLYFTKKKVWRAISGHA